MNDTRVIDTISGLIRNLVPKNANVPTGEGDHIASLVTLFLNPSKSLNPHDIMRKLSDHLVEHMVQHRAKMVDHDVMKMILQLFIIEWCYRNGYMKEDWIWEWNETGKGGQAKMNMDTPISQIPLPNP